MIHLGPPRRRPTSLNTAINRSTRTTVAKCPTPSPNHLPVLSAPNLSGLPRPRTSVLRSHLNTAYVSSIIQATARPHSYTRNTAFATCFHVSLCRDASIPDVLPSKHPPTSRFAGLVSRSPSLQSPGGARIPGSVCHAPRAIIAAYPGR